MSVCVGESAEIYLDKRYGDESVAKQVFVSLITGFLYAVVGFNISYTGIIVPQLLDERNTSTIETTPAKLSWIVSANILGMPLSGLLSGMVVDRFGRVNTMKFYCVPSVIGWFLIAIAKTADVIIVGQFVVGFSISFLINSVFVYMAEVTHPKLRGLFLSSIGLYLSVGLFIIYFQGRFFHWRSIAWIIISYTIVASGLLYFIPESPSWLVSKNRIKQATASLNWFCKDGDNVKVAVKINNLIDENLDKMERENKVSFSTLAQPTVIKPFLILTGLFTFQQFTGVEVITSNIIIFFREMGVTYDLYLVTSTIAVLRIIMSAASLWISKVFNRRAQLFVSGFGMASSLSLSALTTKWMQQNQCEMWIPTVLVMAYYVFSCWGVFVVPLRAIGRTFSP
ncbi:hypothetical protein FQR65_LT18527 [Abscondita terminalis]|nr:hypothetical protein FQR65_LT18527 [Abscondita terminalis]